MRKIIAGCLLAVALATSAFAKKVDKYDAAAALAVAAVECGYDLDLSFKMTIVLIAHEDGITPDRAIERVKKRLRAATKLYMNPINRARLCAEAREAF